MGKRKKDFVFLFRDAHQDIALIIIKWEKKKNFLTDLKSEFSLQKH